MIDPNWSLEKLRRKRDQAWDMAGLARMDGDRKDEERRIAEARKYEAEIERRARENSEG
jgi:hypothetical protein